MLKIPILTTIAALVFFNFLIFNKPNVTQPLEKPSENSFDQALTTDEIINATETNITLHIQGDFTSSDKLSVPIGTTITWINDDIKDHKIISKTGVFDSEIIEPGEKFSYTFSDTGNYKYICDSDINIESEVNVH